MIKFLNQKEEREEKKRIIEGKKTDKLFEVFMTLLITYNCCVIILSNLSFYFRGSVYVFQVGKWYAVSFLRIKINVTVVVGGCHERSNWGLLLFVRIDVLRPFMLSHFTANANGLTDFSQIISVSVAHSATCS